MDSGDVRLEKALEALIDDAISEMGITQARDCYVLRRFQDVMLELKSVNNSDILESLRPYDRIPYDNSKCRSCKKC